MIFQFYPLVFDLIEDRALLFFFFAFYRIFTNFQNNLGYVESFYLLFFVKFYFLIKLN
jgi:hypothetical protein